MPTTPKRAKRRVEPQLPDKKYLQINQAIFALAHAYQSRMQREQRTDTAEPLAISDRAVIMVVGQFAPLNSRQLSKAMDINPGTISVYIQSLVERGLVHREQDPEDRRNWVLQLTAMGTARYRETIAGTVTYTRAFLAALNKAEQSALHDLLLKAAHSIGFTWQ